MNGLPQNNMLDIENTPLSRFAASPRSRIAKRCGQGDAALTRSGSDIGMSRRPLLGCHRLDRASVLRSAMDDLYV